ncbi:MAG: M20 family metallo-hydrolase [Actinomycetota bacterium]
MAPAVTDLSIDLDRLLQRLDELAQIGAIEGTQGNARLALTDEDRDGRDLVVQWMRDLGLHVTIDAIGNVIAVMPSAPDGAGSLAPVLTGSHVDTVRTGGRYDGTLGVLAGLEVIETVMAAGTPLERPLGVAFFTDEEGSRFAPDMLGSLVYAGGMGVEEARAIVGVDGAVLGDELDRIGYAGPAPVPGPAPHAFVELHIEQGPVLEAEGITIGAVTVVQGISWQEVTITGQSNHAGTTPIPLRRDPAVVAAACITAARTLAEEIGLPMVATVGRVELHPNLVNVVPASATFTVDLRHTDDGVLRLAEKRMAAVIDDAAAGEGCSVERRVLARYEPVPFDPSVIDLVANTATRLGHTVTRLPSGAGHDAQMMARMCPTGMIFTPSVRGISHNPEEYTSPGDLEAGANVLLHTLLGLAGADPGPGHGTTASGPDTDGAS